MHITTTHHSSWDKFFENKEFDVLNELEKIENSIADNYAPYPENVLRFMNLDLHKIKYIIVGMEPYPSTYYDEKEKLVLPEATGRSFEVASLKYKSWNDKFKQSSLRNILKTIYYNETNEKVNLETLRNLMNEDKFVISNPTDWFDNVEKQGVMFLNATLTVQLWHVDTHKKYWKNFMEHVIRYMVNENPNVKWVLWGKPAQSRVLPLINESNAICSVHPRLAEFVDENCFQHMNDIHWVC